MILNGTVTIRKLNYCSNDSMPVRKQVFQVTGTSQWHKISVQCGAEPNLTLTTDDNIIYSGFSTVYVHGKYLYACTICLIKH